MKLEFDATDARQVKAAHAALVSLLNGASAPATSSVEMAVSPKSAAATPAATPVAAASTASTATPAASAPATTSSTGTTDMAAATAAFQAFVKANGPGKAKAIMEEFGVKSLKDVPAERLGEFVAKLQA